MTSIKSHLRTKLIERIAQLMDGDPLRMPVAAAVLAPVSCATTGEELSAMADSLLSPSATAFERGVMMGAALAIAAVAEG